MSLIYSIGADKSLDPNDCKSFLYKGETQVERWNRHGFVMEFQCNSLPHGVSEANVDVSVSLWGNFKLPENTKPVSTFYNIRCQQQLLKDVLVKIEHCARDTSKLRFAISSDISPPYKFELVKDGKFIERYGKILRKKFSRFVIVLCYTVASFFLPINHYAALCSSPLNRNIWTVYLFVTLYTKSHLIYLEEDATERNLFIKDYSVVKIEDGAEYLEMDPSVSRDNRDKGLELLAPPRNNIRIYRNTINSIFYGVTAFALFRLRLMGTKSTIFDQQYYIRGAVLNNDCLHLSLSSDESK